MCVLDPSITQEWSLRPCKSLVLNDLVGAIIKSGPQGLFPWGWGGGYMWQYSQIIPGSALSNGSRQCSEDHWGLNPCWPCAKQANWLQYYLALQSLPYTSWKGKNSPPDTGNYSLGTKTHLLRELLFSNIKIKTTPDLKYFYVFIQLFSPHLTK